MDDQNQTPITNSGAQPASGNPFGDQTTAGGTQAQDSSSPSGVTDTPPWLNFAGAEQTATPAQPVATPAVENTFDPFSNPFDDSMEDATQPQQVADESQPYQQASGSGASATDDAMGLLVKLQRQFEYEEEDYQETLRMHEDNIKAEQEAIRDLRQERREKMEEMKKIILGLEKLVGITREKPAASNAESRSNGDARKASAKKSDMQAAKKVDSDDFFTAA